MIVILYYKRGSHGRERGEMEMRQDWMLFLTRIASTRVYRSGETIFLEGDPAAYLYYLEDGLALTYSGGADGRERGVMPVWPGEFFGTSSFLRDGVHKNASVALKQCRVLVIDTQAYQTCREKFPQFVPDMMGELSREVAVLFEQLADSSLLESDVKVARFLCRRVEREHCVRRGAKVLVDFSQDLISRMLGLSRWSVNQALSRFREEGWVDTGYRAIQITDYPALRTFAGMGQGN